MVVSNNAIVFQASQAPLCIEADQVYFVEKANAEAGDPSMLFTVAESSLGPAGIYAVTYESQRPWAVKDAEMQANTCLGPVMSNYKWSMSNFSFHEKLDDDVACAAQGMSGLGLEDKSIA